MQKTRAIALLLLLAFTANFTVFCHCAATQKHSCCCEKKEKKRPCGSATAVKFNLVEKQLADQIQAAPIPVIPHLIQHPLTEPTTPPTPTTPGNVKHPPPDILTLQQRLLI
jgi:hypothetical protein